MVGRGCTTRGAEGARHQGQVALEDATRGTMGSPASTPNATVLCSAPRCTQSNACNIQHTRAWGQVTVVGVLRCTGHKGVMGWDRRT
jgi:hypothetical protein